jgi:hypothetical protein
LRDEIAGILKARLRSFPVGLPEDVVIRFLAPFKILDKHLMVSGIYLPCLGILPSECSHDRRMFGSGRNFQAAWGWTSTPVAPRILIRRSQETDTVAPFLTADTLDRATPDRLTISLTGNPDSPIDFTARRDNSALYFIRAMSLVSARANGPIHQASSPSRPWPDSMTFFASILNSQLLTGTGHMCKTSRVTV